MWDVVIAGAGSAGLSAALVLGRARRRVLVLDHGAPRNAPAEASHSMFTRDGAAPLELLRIAHTQLRPYDTVEVRSVGAEDAARADDGFVVRDGTGVEHATRRVLFATGVEDVLPEIEGMRRFWGGSVFHCPYCHGYELRDRRIAILAAPGAALDMVKLLRGWSRDIVLCTHGADGLPDETRDALARLGVPVHEQPLVAVHGGSDVQSLAFADGSRLECDALFHRPAQRMRGDLPLRLGCELTESGLVRVGADWQTSIPGAYAAGDVAAAMQQVIAAAASGAAAAAMMNHGLLDEDLEKDLEEALAKR